MTRTVIQEYSLLVNHILDCECDFKNIFYRFKLDEKVMNEINDLINNLMSVEKHELKEIKKVMKRYFHLIYEWRCAENERFYSSFSDRFDRSESYSLDMDEQECRENLNVFLEEHKSFFDKYIFCKVVTECYNGESLYIKDILDTDKINIENYRYIIPKKFYLSIIHDIFIFFSKIRIFNNLESIHTKSNLIYGKIDTVINELDNLIQIVKDSNVMIDDIIYHILIDYIY